MAFTPLICTPGPGLASPPVNLDEAKLEEEEQTCLLPSRFVIRSGPIWTEFYTCSGDPGQTLSRLAKLGSANDRVDGTAAALRVDYSSGCSRPSPAASEPLLHEMGCIPTVVQQVAVEASEPRWRLTKDGKCLARPRTTEPRYPSIQYCAYRDTVVFTVCRWIDFMTEDTAWA